MGPALINVHSGDGTNSQATALIAAVAPGIFTAGSSNVAAALVTLTPANGAQTTIGTAFCTAASCSAVPANLGASSDSAVLLLFGTGLRNAAVGTTSVTVGGVPCPVLFSGAQSQFPGLDQINVSLPHSLAGGGTVQVVVSAGAISANVVTIAIQ